MAKRATVLSLFKLCALNGKMCILIVTQLRLLDNFSDCSPDVRPVHAKKLLPQ